MFERWLCRNVKLWKNLLRQHLAQLDTPLVEQIDVPDGALGKDAVLVQRNQLAKRLRRQFLGEDGIGWAIAGEHTMGHEPVRGAFVLDLFCRLAEGKRLRLGEDIREQYIVLLANRIE